MCSVCAVMGFIGVGSVCSVCAARWDSEEDLCVRLCAMGFGVGQMWVRDGIRSMRDGIRSRIDVGARWDSE